PPKTTRLICPRTGERRVAESLNAAGVSCSRWRGLLLGDPLSLTLDSLASGLQQPPQIAGNVQVICQPPEWAERGPELNLVAHDRTAGPCHEPVIVGERPERPGRHHVPEVRRALKYGEFGGQPLPDP